MNNQTTQSKIKPKILKKGDTIGIVALAYPVDQVLLEQGIKYLKDQGFNIVLGEHVYEQVGFSAGKDEDRAADLIEMFSNPEIDAIFCARGGYGSMKVLKYLDFNLFQENPKIFIGYSDITTLLLTIFQKTGLITFHGPMVVPDFSDIEFAEPNYNLLKKVLMNSNSIGIVRNPAEYLDISFLQDGRAKGQLIGGNLSLIVSTLGTPYEIDTREKILFIEEVGEYTYHIDRMLYQLKLAGKFADAVGVIFGEMVRCVPKKIGDPTIDQLLGDFAADLNIPVMYNLAIGHGVQKLTIPIGVDAILDSDFGLLILESSVFE